MRSVLVVERGCEPRFCCARACATHALSVFNGQLSAARHTEVWLQPERDIWPVSGRRFVAVAEFRVDGLPQYACRFQSGLQMSAQFKASPTERKPEQPFE